MVTHIARLQIQNLLMTFKRVYRVATQLIAYRWRSLPRVRRLGASKAQGSSERVLPWQVTMDQVIFASLSHTQAGRPGSSEVPRNPLTRWDVSSIPANGIFLPKKLKKLKMPNGWRTIKSLVHKIRLHGRRGKGMAESFSREKLRHAPQKEGG